VSNIQTTVNYSLPQGVECWEVHLSV